MRKPVVCWKGAEGKTSVKEELPDEYQLFHSLERPDLDVKGGHARGKRIFGRPPSGR